MKEGSELEGGRGVGVSDVLLDDGKRQHLARLDNLTLPLVHFTEDNDRINIKPRCRTIGRLYICQCESDVLVRR